MPVVFEERLPLRGQGVQPSHPLLDLFEGERRRPRTIHRLRALFRLEGVDPLFDRVELVLQDEPLRVTLVLVSGVVG